MVAKLFRALAKRVRQLGASLAEKPASGVDAHELEHFLLYHGLVGSSPENQRSFKDVRADVKIAVQETNSLKMSIALKLPPLWWEDKLKAIFGEIVDHEGNARAVASLFPEMSDDTWPNRFDPLGHQDWHVRSNAALMLAFVQAVSAAPRMVRALHDAADGGDKCAFPHVAYALGKLGVDDGRAALEKYLYHEDPWFRVDAAGALSHWPIAASGETVMRAMLDQHPLSDYMAVAITRRQKPLALMRSGLPSAVAGSCALVIGVLDASRQTFSFDIVTDSGVFECATSIAELACKDPSPLHLRAALSLADFAEFHELDQEFVDPRLIAEVRATVASDPVRESIVNHVRASNRASEREITQLRSAIILAGELKLADALPALTLLLSVDDALLIETIEALGKIGDQAAVQPLLHLSKQLVSMQQRTGLPLSKQPVTEDEPGRAKAYWAVLKALGEIGATAAVPYLIEACSDYAPDKRDQALISLLSVYRQSGSKDRQSFKDSVRQALSDPAPQVRIAALDAVCFLQDVAFVDEAVKLTDSPEVSVGKKAYAALSVLWQGGYREQVEKSVKAALGGQGNKFRQEKLNQFLNQQRLSVG
jgi:HEAT repeat protein